MADIYDQWLEEEKAQGEEASLAAPAFRDPKPGFLLLQCMPLDSGAASQTELTEIKDRSTGEVVNRFKKLRFGFKVVGADSANAAGDGPYRSQFFRIGIDEKGKEGKPAGRLLAFRNTLLAPGLPKGGSERAARALAVQRTMVKEQGLSSDPENYDFGEAELAAHHLAVTCGALEPHPLIIARAYVAAARKYTDQQGEARMTKERVELTDFEDATPEAIVRLGIKIWD